MTVRMAEDDVIAVDPRPRGRLYGTTAITGTPDEFVQRRVQVVLIENLRIGMFPGAALIATTASDSNGDWRVDGLDPTTRYAVIAYDHTGRYDPVVKTNLLPTVS